MKLTENNIKLLVIKQFRINHIKDIAFDAVKENPEILKSIKISPENEKKFRRLLDVYFRRNKGVPGRIASKFTDDFILKWGLGVAGEEVKPVNAPRETHKLWKRTKKTLKEDIFGENYKEDIE
jgi:hypothetical protein